MISHLESAVLEGKTASKEAEEALRLIAGIQDHLESAVKNQEVDAFGRRQLRRGTLGDLMSAYTTLRQVNGKIKDMTSHCRRFLDEGGVNA